MASEDQSALSSTTTTMTPDELDRLIKHLRKRDQSFIASLGTWRHTMKTDHCVAADYLEALRSELPHWQVKESQYAG